MLDPSTAPLRSAAAWCGPQPVPLSQLIDIVNERFGTDFNQADQLFFDQIVEAAMADDGLRQAAAVNPGDKFELVFKSLLENLFVERMDQNEDIFVRFMNDAVLPEDRDGLDGVGDVPAAEERRRSRRIRTRGTPGHCHRHCHPACGSSSRSHRSATRPVCPSSPSRPPREHSATLSRSTTMNLRGVAIETGRRLRRGMFVAQVVGKSMEPAISDGAYCLFAAPVGGSRQGKSVLVQMRDAADPESGEPLHRQAI